MALGHGLMPRDCEPQVTTNWRIGVNFGGTKIEALAIDANGREALRRCVPIPVGDYHGTLADIRELVAGMESQLGTASVGIGIPGAIFPFTGLVKNANSTWLIGQALDRDLTSALNRPVRLANDADCVVFGVRRHRDERASALRPECHCRRMGTQTSPLADR